MSLMWCICDELFFQINLRSEDETHWESCCIIQFACVGNPNDRDTSRSAKQRVLVYNGQCASKSKVGMYKDISRVVLLCTRTRHSFGIRTRCMRIWSTKKSCVSIQSDIDTHLHLIYFALTFSSDGQCFYVASVGRQVCITGKLIYELGKAASEPCNNANNGKQKCVGTEGFITCANSNFIIFSFVLITLLLLFFDM